MKLSLAKFLTYLVNAPVLKDPAENPAPHPSRKPPPPPPPPPRKLHPERPPPRNFNKEEMICQSLANYFSGKYLDELNPEELSLLCDLEEAGWIAVIR